MKCTKCKMVHRTVNMRMESENSITMVCPVCGHRMLRREDE